MNVQVPRLRLWLVCLLLAGPQGCTPYVIDLAPVAPPSDEDSERTAQDSEAAERDSDASQEDTQPSGDSAAGGDSAQGHTGDSARPVLEWDCESLPEAPLEVNQLNAPRGYHDLAFDAEGRVIGSDNSSLLAVSYDDVLDVYAPGLGQLEGFDWLPNGDLAVSVQRDGSLSRVTPEGGVSVIAGDVGAYGVILGPDEKLYVANYTAVYRVDPDTGAMEEVVRNGSIRPRVLNFSPDYSTLYVGTLSGNGDLYRVELDENLNATGPLQPFATGVGTGSYHDSLGVDACGNLYVADYSTSSLFRVTPEGETTPFYYFGYSPYGHGLKWGEGIGGWREDAIYMPQPYNQNRVIELVIGVPSRYYPSSDRQK